MKANKGSPPCAHFIFGEQRGFGSSPQEEREPPQARLDWLRHDKLHFGKQLF